jgi:glycosyltransferase involved in cell wall biosynthesis
MYARKVSIIVPVYNCASTIEKCLLSLISQTYENKEIIVVDDHSIDDTSEILRRMAEEYNIKVIRLPRNSGEGVARNEGIKYATGDIIFEAEADAHYERDYIELCVRHLEDPKIGTVIGALHAWPENSIWYKWWEAKRRITLHNYKVLGGWFFRRSDLEKIGYFREDL